jgi:PAS domain S-box-containing protein
MIEVPNEQNDVGKLLATSESDRKFALTQLAPASDWRAITKSEHFVQFYESNEFLMRLLTDFVGSGLKEGDACIVLATKPHLDELNQRLHINGFDVDAAESCRQYFPLDANSWLSKLVLDGRPDGNLFTETVGSVVRQASGTQRRVRIFGEMVALLCEGGDYNSAVALEQLWNDLRGIHEFSLFCAYPINQFAGNGAAAHLSDVCGQHGTMIPTESYSGLNQTQERLREVILLQQRARLLEIEIAERELAEERLRRSERELRDFIENAMFALRWVGPDGTIAWANQAELNLLGYSKEEYVGHNIREFHADGEAADDILLKFANQEELRDYEARVRCKDGSTRYVVISSNPYSENGEFIHTRCFTRDITDRKQGEAAAARLAAIIASSSDAIISKTLQGIITSWNASAQRMFGYTSEEIVGQSILRLIPKDRRSEEDQILKRLKAGELIDHYETVRVTKDGRSLDVSLTISPIRDNAGRIIGASKIIHDITERKQVEVERERLIVQERAARAEAETANRLKDEFLATVSHELRTPLNAIIGWCHMLGRAKPDAATVDHALKTIERNAKLQAQLIEDILDVSRIITGKVRLNTAPVDMAAVINAAVDSVQLASEAKNVKLEVQVDPSARHLHGDSTRLQQVIWNLLSNAIKFTPEGGSVSIRLERTGQHAQIIVSDTGDGIDPMFLPFIFDRFRQADGTSTRRQSGLGLGLSIVRQLIELHGGTVNAQSAGPGHGSTFRIMLPLAQQGRDVRMRSTGSLAPPEELANYLQPLPSLSGLEVLLVDDDKDNLNVIGALLTEHKATVQTAASAVEALELLRFFKPDVLISDLAMPEEDGYSLIRKIRELEGQNRRISAVALTALVRVEDRARALAAGFNMFVPKPIQPSELITTIANLGQRKAEG